MQAQPGLIFLGWGELCAAMLSAGIWRDCRDSSDSLHSPDTSGVVAKPQGRDGHSGSSDNKRIGAGS